MGKAVTGKLKTLYIMKALYEKTDEEHAMSAADLISELERYGLTADRRSIYDEIATLQQFGLDIIYTKRKPSGYYLASREFETVELKILMDAVQASRFISEGKSRKLIKKLEGLAGRNEGKALRSSTDVTASVKTENESTYYSIDTINEAIADDRKIRFRYCEWNTAKKLAEKNAGEIYEISPWQLSWCDENYYLNGYDSREGRIRSFRVDHMKEAEILKEQRSGKDKFEEYDTGKISREMFGMFGGDLERVTLRCRENLAGTIIDSFGTGATLVDTNDGWFEVNQDVAPDGSFYGWVFGFGEDMKIIGPEDVTADFRNMIGRIHSSYTEEE